MADDAQWRQRHRFRQFRLVRISALPTKKKNFYLNFLLQGGLAHGQRRQRSVDQYGDEHRVDRGSQRLPFGAGQRERQGEGVVGGAAVTFPAVVVGGGGQESDERKFRDGCRCRLGRSKLVSYRVIQIASQRVAQSQQTPATTTTTGQ